MLRKDNDLLRYINKKNKDTRGAVMARYKSRVDATKQDFKFYCISMEQVENNLAEYRKFIVGQENKLGFFPK